MISKVQALDRRYSMLKKIIASIMLLAFILVSLPAHAEGPIILVNAVTAPKDISPGDSFDLKLKVKNSGGSRTNNLIVTLDVNNVSASTAPTTQEQKSVPSQFPISAIGDSNVRYLGSIAAGAEKETSFQMVADGAAHSGTYNMNVKLDYNNARAQNQVIGIVLVRKADLMLEQISAPKTVELNKEFKLTADVVNEGNYPINGVSVELSGDGSKIKSPNYFIGVLDASGSDTYETAVKFTAPGEKTLQLKVNYTDDFNRRQSVTKDLKIKVNEGTKLPAKKSKSGGFFSKIINFFKALLGFGENQE